MSLLFINLLRNNILKCAFTISNAIDINKYKPHKQEEKRIVLFYQYRI